MIAAIVKGTGFRGAAEYVFHGRKGEKQERGEIVFSNMAGRMPRELACEWGAFRRMRPKLGKAVCHVSLSLAPEDETLSDADWSVIAQRFMEELGFAECPFMAYRHNDTDHGHIHLLASRVDMAGNVVSDRHDFARAEKILRRIEVDYKLRQVTSSQDKKNNKEGKPMNNHTPTSEMENTLPETDNGDFIAECGDKNLNDKKRRNYQRRLLEDAYSRQVSMMFADVVRYVERKPGQLTVHTSEGGNIKDTGDKLVASNMAPQASAERIVLMCIGKGWESVQLSGNDEFLRLAMKMAMQRGLKVKANGPHQLAILAEIETEISVRTMPTVKPIQKTSPASTPTTKTTTPANPVDEMKGMAGVLDRTQGMRKWSDVPLSKRFPSRGPK